MSDRAARGTVTLFVAQSRGIGWNTYRQNTGRVIQVNDLCSDESVVYVDQDSRLFAVAPGQATVSYWQNLDNITVENGETEWGECFVYSTITVAEEGTVFSLNESSIALVGEGTFQLEPVYDVQTLGEPLSITWESFDTNFAQVDDNGLVSVNSPFRPFYVTVLCHRAVHRRV